MSDYVIKIPDGYVFGEGDVYYPDERHEPMGIEPVVRCRDCHWAKPDQSDHDYRGEYHCNMWIADVSADGYCWRGSRKEVAR